MIKPDSPRDLATNILARSICDVQVGAVIIDHKGNIISWGWNNMHKTGYGICAERHALARANKGRAKYGTIYVAGKWRDRNKLVNAKPCNLCAAMIRKYKMLVVYRTKQGEWK